MFYNGNIIEKIYKIGRTKDWIEMWESSFYTNSSKIENLLYPNLNYWDSTSYYDSPYFIIHFKTILIHIKEYSLQNLFTDKYPQSWKVYGAMNNETWLPIGEVLNDNQFNITSNKLISFPVNESTFNWFKFVFTESTYTLNGGVGVYLTRLEITGHSFPFTLITLKTKNYIRIFFLNLYIFIIL